MGLKPQGDNMQGHDNGELKAKTTTKITIVEENAPNSIYSMIIKETEEGGLIKNGK